MSNIIDLLNTAAAVEDSTGPLDPCPSCNSRPHDAPEGIHDVHSIRSHPGAQVGDPKWYFGHCWKCGFRPGTNQAVSDVAMRRAFETFKSQYLTHLNEVAASDPRQALSPPPADPDVLRELNDLRAQLAEIQAKESGDDGTS